MLLQKRAFDDDARRFGGLEKGGPPGYDSVEWQQTMMEKTLYYKILREEELIGVDDPWTPSKFEFREKVRSAKGLSVNGEVLVALGAVGEVIKVIRDAPGGVAYHVHFDSLAGRVLQIPEAALEALEGKE